MQLLRRSSITLGLLCLTLFAWDIPAIQANHPFHVCVGQMELNPQTARWEVSLRMHPRDLELALSDFNHKNITREDENFQAAAIDYLENQFFLFHAPDSQDLKSITQQIATIPALRSMETKERDKQPSLEDRSRLEWIGMESERGWLWIHLELIPPKPPAPDTPLFLAHRIFMDRIDAQENSVAILHTRTQRSSLQFKKAEPIKPFLNSLKDR